MKSEEGGRIRRRNSEEEEETKEEDKEENKSAPSGQALRYSALKALGTIDRGQRRTWYEIAPGWSRTGAPLGRRPLSAMLRPLR